MLHNGDHQRAGDIQIGDYVCTSEGTFAVVAKEMLSENTPVFEVTIAEDRPVFMQLEGASPEMAAAFGTTQIVPYSPAEMVEFRFKGLICSIMDSAETWLSQFGQMQGF